MICFDVDGVLRKGLKALPRARESLIKLRLVSILCRQKNVPFAIVTNGGGETETVRADKISKVLNLDSKNIAITGDQTFLCHSPMKSLKQRFGGKPILVSGTGDLDSVMTEYGFEKYITSFEYAMLFPHIFPHFFVNVEYVDDLIYQQDCTGQSKTSR